MIIKRADIYEPWEDVETDEDKFDLKASTGNDLVMQRILRGYFTIPGTLHHRPRWGAGLQTYQSETPTINVRQRLVKDAERFLLSLPFVDESSVTVTADGQRFEINTRVRVDGEELALPEVTIG